MSYKDGMLKIENHDDTVGLALSGGLDSCIVLHHLLECGNSVFSYTIQWGRDSTEADAARRIADHYGIRHTVIPFTPPEYFRALDCCMIFFDKPRWNVWPFLVMEKAHEDGLRHFYIGEGCDEIFGYSDRCYLQGWIDLIEYHLPTWILCSEVFGIELHTPFKDKEGSFGQPSKKPTTYHLPYTPQKDYIYNMYKDRLPMDLIIYPKNQPMVLYYDVLGMNKYQLQREATRRWVNMH